MQKKKNTKKKKTQNKKNNNNNNKNNNPKFDYRDSFDWIKHQGNSGTFVGLFSNNLANLLS